MNFLRRLFQRKTDDIEACKQQLAEERQKSHDYVNGLKADLARLNGEKKHGPSRT